MDATIWIATFMATTLMTLFSYMVALLVAQPFKEPFLLAVLLNKFKVTDNTTNRVIGWILHYVLGLLFVLFFEVLLQMKWLSISWSSALIYGVVIGILGILGWKILFHVTNKKPKMNYTGYYTQLFIAHVIFAFTMVACYMYF